MLTFFKQPAPPEHVDELQALQERTRERQRAMLDQMVRERRHVSTGHPVELKHTDVTKTFQRAREREAA